MIPNTRPLDAVYRHDTGRKTPNGNTVYTWDRAPVIAWNNEGEPLVTNPHTHRLIPATALTGFYKLEEPDTAVVAAVPGGGWTVAYREPDGTETREPVIAWLIHADGTTVPVDEYTTDITLDPTCMDTFDRLIQPDA